jgi:hypothetical protein
MDAHLRTVMGAPGSIYADLYLHAKDHVVSPTLAPVPEVNRRRLSLLVATTPGTTAAGFFNKMARPE